MGEGFLIYSWGRRLWLVGWGPSYRLWFSERWDSKQATGPPFHQHNWIDIDPPAPGRQPRAITGLECPLGDEELIIWKDTDAWILSGAGPETFVLRKYLLHGEELIPEADAVESSP